MKQKKGWAKRWGRGTHPQQQNFKKNFKKQRQLKGPTENIKWNDPHNTGVQKAEKERKKKSITCKENRHPDPGGLELQDEPKQTRIKAHN